MAAPTFEKLKDEYSRLWANISIRSTRSAGIERQARKILTNRSRYEKVSAKTGVPWWFIGVIHSLECGLRFSGHLHNGDSLKGRTRRVPAGRPRVGSPPFTWEESACDALTMKGLHKLTDWSIERVCYELERYNGWGYRLYHSRTLSPYLWAGTTHYARGKYVADGKWSSSAVSQQSGAVALLKSLEGLGVPVAGVVRQSTQADKPVALPREKQREVVKSSRRLTFGERVTNFLEWIGLGGISSFVLLQQVRDFATDWRTLAILVIGVGAWGAFKWTKYQSLREIAEGRYIPSGETAQ